MGPMVSVNNAYSDSDAYPPLSALNDLLFCPRRCFLHRVEGVWVENVHTTAGTLDHRRVHAARDSDRPAGRAARGLWVVRHRLRLAGVCDLVEFRPVTPDLPRRTQDAAARPHALLASRIAPPPVVHPKCRGCSVRDVCLPNLLAAPNVYRRAAADLFRVS